MKKSEITPKVIELAKKIAEYWRMPIYKGCWVYLADDNELNIWWKDSALRMKSYQGEHFPIPTISDCLEKLSNISASTENELLRLLKNLWHGYHTNTIELHEVLLSALLEVLRKEVTDGE